MNVEMGTEAVQFPEKEYINGTCVAVQCPVEQDSDIATSVPVK
jgi:hypothetical protein